MSKEKSAIDSLMDELQESTNIKPILDGIDNQHLIKSITVEDLDEEDLSSFILKKSALLIETGLDTLDMYRKKIHSGCDAEEMDSYTKLINSTSTAITNVSKIAIQNKKDKAAKELKEMTLEGKKPNITNNILIASREEIMNRITSGKPVIDVQSDD